MAKFRRMLKRNTSMPSIDDISKLVKLLVVEGNQEEFEAELHNLIDRVATYETTCIEDREFLNQLGKQLRQLHLTTIIHSVVQEEDPDD